MTNPPFYASAEEIAARAAAKDTPRPNGGGGAACLGAPVEMTTPGGEVGFAARLVEESLAHPRGAVRWYTTMLGKLESVGALVALLRARGADGNYAIAELAPGSATKRWAVGWSFLDPRPELRAARGFRASGGGGVSGGVLPPATEADVVTIVARDPATGRRRRGVTARELGGRVREAVAALALEQWTWDEAHLAGVGRAAENVWSRAWRRRQAQKGKKTGQQLEGRSAVEEDECPARPGSEPQRDGKAVEKTEDPTTTTTTTTTAGFGFRIEIETTTEDGDEAPTVRIRCRWLSGRDAVMYESFRGWLKRRVEAGGAPLWEAGAGDVS
jgi:23S rRNA (adenine1618-N6)-methyltransferase